MNKLSLLLLILLALYGKVTLAGNPITNQPNYVQELSGTYTSDVVIEYQNCVKVVGTVKMAPGTKIHVKAGGVLYIGSGAKITCTTDDNSNGTTTFWNGVQCDVGIDGGYSLGLEYMLCPFIDLIESGADEPDDFLDNGTYIWFSFIKTTSPGMVYMDGGTIRYSRYGICAGYDIDYLWANNVLPFNEAFLLPYVSRSFHYVHLVNSHFENNLIHDICFSKSTYQQDGNMTNLSKINNNVFDVENKTGITDFFGSHMSIFTYHNDFKFPISGNFFNFRNFKVNEYAPIGLASWDSRYNLTGNYFFEASIGVFSDKIFPGASRSYITDNVFINCLRSAHLGGNVEVVDNTFGVRQKMLRKGTEEQLPIGIGIFSGDNILCKANEIFDYGGGWGTRENSIGIVSKYNVGQSSTLIRNNSAIQVSIFHQSEEFNYNAKLICNSSSDLEIADWTHASVSLNPNMGMEDQGTSTNPAGNNFWDNYPVGSSYEHISNYFGKSFDYYYSTTNSRAPTEVSNVSLVSVSGGTRNCLTFIYSPSFNYLDCVKELIFSGEMNLRDEYDDIHEFIEGELSGGSSLNELNIRTEYDVSLASLVGNYVFLLYSDTVFNDSIYTAMHSVCMSHYTMAGIKSMYEFWFQEEDLDSMSLYRGYLEDSASVDSFVIDYLHYLNIVEGYLQVPDSVGKIGWLTSYADSIYNITSDSNNYLWQRGQMLVNLIELDTSDKMVWDYYYFPSPLEFVEHPEGEDSVLYEFTVSPNPFSSYFTLRVEDLYHSRDSLGYEIVNLQGTTVEEDIIVLSGLGSDNFNLGSTLSNSGYYFLRVIGEGEIVFTAIIYRN